MFVFERKDNKNIRETNYPVVTMRLLRGNLSVTK